MVVIRINEQELNFIRREILTRIRGDGRISERDMVKQPPGKLFTRTIAGSFGSIRIKHRINVIRNDFVISADQSRLTGNIQRMTQQGGGKPRSCSNFNNDIRARLQRRLE